MAAVAVAVEAEAVVRPTLKVVAAVLLVQSQPRVGELQLQTRQMR
jgi:hypothetical protein